jgi:thiol-disulfide isomerase/thioredoxin
MRKTTIWITFISIVIWLVGCSQVSIDVAQPPTSDASVRSTPTSAEEVPPKKDLQKDTLVNLPNLGSAPELQNEIWLNVDQPLRLADLRGKVVLLEMWTFGCINCQHVIPSLLGWDAKYRDQGLVIIGNHFPEFSYEQDLDNLKQAVDRYEIKYAVAQDNDGQTWQAYNNHYWPALYLIDKTGNIRYTHIGEGAYQDTEQAIKTLLAEPYAD